MGVPSTMTNSGLAPAVAAPVAPALTPEVASAMKKQPPPLDEALLASSGVSAGARAPTEQASGVHGSMPAGVMPGGGSPLPVHAIPVCNPPPASTVAAWPSPATQATRVAQSPAIGTAALSVPVPAAASFAPAERAPCTQVASAPSAHAPQAWPSPSTITEETTQMSEDPIADTIADVVSFAAAGAVGIATPTHIASRSAPPYEPNGKTPAAAAVPAPDVPSADPTELSSPACPGQFDEAILAALMALPQQSLVRVLRGVACRRPAEAAVALAGENAST